MRKLIFFFLVTAAIDLHAQDDYVLTMKNDTLRGPIRILTYDVMDRIAVGKGSKKTTLTAVQVRFAIQDSIMYTPVRHLNTIRFMQVLRPGYLTLYAYRQEHQNTYDGRLLSKMNGQSLDLPNIGFKKILSDFLSDCQPTAEKVKAGEFERSKVEGIVDDYNECVARQNAATVSVTEMPTPTTDAIAALRTKVEASTVESKQEILDLINDLDGKARKKQPIPSYLTNALKSYLADKKEFEEELNKVLSLVNQ
jgi:hypothetical protein